jgi:hypothetical protein
MRSRLERARSTGKGIRVVRSIPGADVMTGYVLDLGPKWVLMTALDGTRVDGFVALRIRDMESIQPLKSGAFFRKASELAGVWPPVLPAEQIDLGSTRSLIKTAHAHTNLVNLQIEREDPDVAFIGVPTRWSKKKVWLNEVDAEAIWNDTVSKWAFARITRVEFSTTYERDLLLVAGPPPKR